jgi:hypothetical protein
MYKISKDPTKVYEIELKLDGGPGSGRKPEGKDKTNVGYKPKPGQTVSQHDRTS